MNKIQNYRQNRFGHLGSKIGIYLRFGIYHLEFVTTKPVEFRLCRVRLILLRVQMTLLR